MYGREERGTANSTLFVSWDIGAGIGTLLGGVLAEAFGFGFAFWCAGESGRAWVVSALGCRAYWRHEA